MSFITDLSVLNSKEYFGKIATTNYYQVHIGTPSPKFLTDLQTATWGPKINFDTFGKQLGLLCADATIPASTYATAEVKDNFMGVPQEFAHTRLYTDIDFSFYIDSDYRVINFFEFWMNYIGGGSEVPASSMKPTLSPDSPSYVSDNAYRRFNYPEDYKSSQVYIIKFERDYKKIGRPILQYRLINAFPKSVTSIPISYGPTELLKMTVTMNYDRYIVGRSATPAPTTSSSGNAATGNNVSSDLRIEQLERSLNNERGAQKFDASKYSREVGRGQLGLPGEPRSNSGLS